MTRQKSSLYASVCFLVICIVGMGFLSSCSGPGGGTQYPANTEPGTLPAGTGAITFQVVWQSPASDPSGQIIAAAFFNSCTDYGIGTISATVSSGTTTVASTSWPCSLHQGSVLGVPAGSNYTVRVNGISSGQTTWSGQVTSIAVIAGNTTNAGTVALTYVGADATIPTVSSSGPNSSPTSTTNIPVTDRFNIVFSKSMAISTVTSTNNITLNSGTVAGTVSYDIASKTASFIPSLPLAYNTQYVLQVVSCTDTYGHSLSGSYTKTFTTETAPIVAPGTPTGLTAKAGNGQVTLDWPAVNGAESYNIYFSNTPGAGTAGTQILAVRAPSVHAGLTNGTPYYYVVTAYNSSLGLESVVSAESGTTPVFPASNPAAPASLAVNFNGGTAPYTVTWPTVAGMSYNLYWSPRAIYPDHNAADNVVRSVTTPGSYVHSGVQNGATYCYIVTAVNAAGESADSMQVCGPGAGSIQVTWP